MKDRLGIAGTGAIACGLARAAAGTHEVVLWARSNGSRDRACATVEDGAEVVTDLPELAGCAVIVEAIAEELDAKRGLLERLGELLPEETALATPTSSLSGAELAGAGGRGRPLR